MDTQAEPPSDRATWPAGTGWLTWHILCQSRSWPRRAKERWPTRCCHGYLASWFLDLSLSPTPSPRSGQLVVACKSRWRVVLACREFCGQNTRIDRTEIWHRPMPLPTFPTFVPSHEVAADYIPSQRVRTRPPWRKDRSDGLSGRQPASEGRVALTGEPAPSWHGSEEGTGKRLRGLGEPESG